jgi:hypothetical protein
MERILPTFLHNDARFIFFCIPGTDVMISEICSAKKMAFVTQNKAKLCKNLIITLVFEKKRQCSRQKLAI